MKRTIRYIVVHCTGTHRYKKVQHLLDKWKTDYQSEVPPYHYLIEPNGETKHILENKCMASGEFPNNEECIHVAYIGGIDRNGKDADTMGKRQEYGLHNILMALCSIYHGTQIAGVRDMKSVPDTLPCFDVRKWLKDYVPDVTADTMFEGREHELYPKTPADPFFESCEFLEEAA